MKNILFVHGGGPTAVINASLAGALEELKREGFAGKILAARFGSQGLVQGDFLDLTKLNEKDFALLNALAARLAPLAIRCKKKTSKKLWSKSKKPTSVTFCSPAAMARWIP
jgi:hypothetical protein